MSWVRILGAWRLLEADFQSEYHIRLASPKVRRRMTWREFTGLVFGLLHADTRLLRELKPVEESVSGPQYNEDEETPAVR